MALQPFTRTTYQYNPSLDLALQQMKDVAAQYAPGGKIAKAMTTAQESALAQGKRKSMSNIAQQLVSAGLAGTTNLPSAELGYEAEVMAPARTQLESQLAQMYANLQMTMAEQMARGQTATEQMQYGAIQGALNRAASMYTPPKSTGFMQGYDGGGGGMSRPSEGIGGFSFGQQPTMQQPTVQQPYTGPTGTLLSPAGWAAAESTPSGGMSPQERAAAERLVAQGYATPYGKTYSLLPEEEVPYPMGRTGSQISNRIESAMSAMYPKQWW